MPSSMPWGGRGMGMDRETLDQRWTREAGCGASRDPRLERRAQRGHGGHGPKSRLRGRGLAAEIGEDSGTPGQIWGRGQSGQK